MRYLLFHCLIIFLLSFFVWGSTPLGCLAYVKADQGIDTRKEAACRGSEGLGGLGGSVQYQHLVNST